MRVSVLSLIGNLRKRVPWQSRWQGSRREETPASLGRPAALSVCLASEVIALILASPRAASEASDTAAELRPRSFEKERKKS